jgi:hypothetical protein
MSKLKQDKIPAELTEDDILRLALELEEMENRFRNWKLVRERDGLTKYGRELGWIEWGDDDRFKEKHDEPAIGRSCMLDPHQMSFTWLTTSVTEIVEQREDYVKFKTQNSNYELFKL